MEYLYLLLLLLPVFGAVACVIGGNGPARTIALVTSIMCFVLTFPLIQEFKFAEGGVQLPGNFGDIDALNGFSISFGIDSISLWLIVLAVFLQPLAIAASFDSIRERAKEYYAWMLLLLSAMLGVFMARDALLFYVFFELTLIPMFFIIGVWGGPQRRYAAGKFFLFTFTGSVFTLAAILYLGLKADSFDITRMIEIARTLSGREQFWIALGFLAGFAVKVPLFPVHTWLPLAHTEAPTAGSVILAGVLLKLGTYGILRLVVPVGFTQGGPVVSEWSTRFIQVVAVLSICGVIYGALVAWVQQDIKKLVAYSSVSHLGFCVLGLAALNHEGLQGSVLYMINHGLSTGAMFLVIGMIYDRYHTRDINELSGLAKKMPKMAFFFILFTLSSIGLPGLNGFASEFLTIQGAFKSPQLGPVYGAFAALGIILGAVYMLHMAARVIWGPLKTPGGHDHDHHGHSQADQGQAASPGHDDGHLSTDLNGREMGILIPLAVVVIVLGIIPGKLLNSIRPPVTELVGQHDPLKPEPKLAARQP